MMEMDSPIPYAGWADMDDRGVETECVGLAEGRGRKGGGA